MHRFLPLVLVLSVIVGTAASAQELRVGGLVSGFVSWYSGDDYQDEIDELDSIQGVTAENLTPFGFAIGPTVEFGINENFALQTAIQYAQRRVGAEFSDNVATVTFIESVNTIDIPVFLKPRVDATGTMSFHALLGAHFSLILGDIEGESTEEINGTTYSFTQTVEPDNRLLFGPTVGAGIATDLDTGTLSFDLVYIRSLNSPFDDVQDAVTGETLFEAPILQNFGVSVGFVGRI